MESSQDQAIGIFDSGVGGLSVLKELKKLLPNESFLYFGDTAHLPYGNKSKEAIQRFTAKSAAFLIEQSVKLLIIACNSASAHAIQCLRASSMVPIVEVIEPGAKRAAEMTKSGRIAVIGTKATISSEVYRLRIHQILPNAEVLSIACPLFVPLVEEGFISHPAAYTIAREYLEPIKSKVDTLLLGCTHYPFLEKVICQAVGREIQLVDSAYSCAKEVKSILEAKGLAKNAVRGQADKYFVTDDPQKFKQLGEQFMQAPIEDIELVNLF